MRYLISYIYHFLVSNSRHGTHSPFVYALADKVIYNPSYKSHHVVEFPEGFNPVYLPMLKKILSFWEIDKLSDNFKDQEVQAYWINIIQDPETLLKLVESGKILFIHEPYMQKHSWKKLIEDQRVTVSINLFHFGIVMQRAGQEKEDFLLRYVG